MTTMAPRIRRSAASNPAPHPSRVLKSTAYAGFLLASAALKFTRFCIACCRLSLRAHWSRVSSALHIGDRARVCLLGSLHQILGHPQCCRHHHYCTLCSRSFCVPLVLTPIYLRLPRTCSSVSPTTLPRNCSSLVMLTAPYASGIVALSVWLHLPLAVLDPLNPSDLCLDAEVSTMFSSHSIWVSAVAFHPTRPGVFASASYDSTAKLWDARSRTPLSTISDQHTEKVRHPDLDIASIPVSPHLTLLRIQHCIHSSLCAPH